ncbi:MAG: response regulator transcription factor [Bryobacterales bacterium]|nr:response regulator transcription factor [Bryobacterales bacterium]
MKKPRILLADDHRIVLEGLRSLLEPDYHLVGMATNGRELLELAATLRPDVVVADISMPLLNGIDATRQLRERDELVKIVVLTMHPDAVYATRAIEAGASAYVLKHAASDELVTAIEAALRGETFISPEVRNPAMDELLDPMRRHTKSTLELTPRQREVLQLLAEGKSAKEIGALLEISPRTVETHKYKMMDDLGVKTSAQLVQHAIKHGLISA